MSFGGLLGSLYGDLPEPKSGPIPTEGNYFSKVNNDNSTQSSQAKEKNEDVIKNDTTDQANNEVNSKSSQPFSLATSLLPPVTRRRAKPLHETGKTLVVQSKETVPEFKSSFADQTGLLSGELEFKSNNIIPQTIVNEYDPSHPNSYDDYVKERAREKRRHEEFKRQQEEMERVREEQKKTLTTTQNSSEDLLDITGDEAWKRRKQMSVALFGTEPNQMTTARTLQSVHTSTTATSSLTKTEKTAAVGSIKSKTEFARKMLEKMGWKEGEGLGREKQGMVHPLVARKTDKRSGVIVQGGKTQTEPVASKPLPPANATRILLLTNMVGKGETDNELESETVEEGAKYGHLLSVQIVELDNYPDHESVRIFCEYELVEHAVKAYQNFNNRLFGGRRVKARFFNEELYNRGQLKGHLT